MELTREAIAKIKSFVRQKDLKESLVPIPNIGEFQVEHSYDIMENKKVDDHIFVVSIIMKYENGSLRDKRYGLYAFDKNGNFVPDYEEKNGCYYGFFNDLKLIETVI
jgi:hypothetical protein